MTPTDLVGYLASAVVLGTFCVRGMVALRATAIASNLAFIAYGLGAGIDPVLVLHLLLLPLNAVRLAQERTLAGGAAAATRRGPADAGACRCPQAAGPQRPDRQEAAARPAGGAGARA